MNDDEKYQDWSKEKLIKELKATNYRLRHAELKALRCEDRDGFRIDRHPDERIVPCQMEGCFSFALQEKNLHCHQCECGAPVCEGCLEYLKLYRDEVLDCENCAAECQYPLFFGPPREEEE